MVSETWLQKHNWQKRIYGYIGLNKILKFCAANITLKKNQKSTQRSKLLKNHVSDKNLVSYKIVIDK